MSENPPLPPITPPTPDLAARMKRSAQRSGVTYEQALHQTRNSLKDRRPSASDSKPR